MTSKVSLVFLASFIVAMGEVTDWTTQCDRCKCKWSGGKKSADCRNASYGSIPSNLSNELRDIDFSFNPLYELRVREFANKNLSDVQKLKMHNCSIRDVHYKAFEGMTLLIELDLSDNKILKLHADVFETNSRLRVVILSNNRLKRLEEGLFSDKQFQLQRVQLDHNNLESLSRKVFSEANNVTHLDLHHNALRTMDGHFLDGFIRITSLTLDSNPWVCDCHLQDFRNTSISKNLIVSHTECEEPPKMRGQLWNDHHTIFACAPEILTPDNYEPIDVTSSNYTISCKVEGVPTPDIDWVTNGKIIDRDPRQSVQKYITTETRRGGFVWNNLTIINFNYRDKGEYKCVAKNPGGVAERNVTLLISANNLNGVDYGNSAPLIIGLTVGALILLIIIFVLIYCCCRRTGRDSSTIAKNRSLSQSNEFVSLDGHHNEMGKALITEVNPIVKPPRQQSVPASVISGGTEVSETKKMLDEDSMYGDEESRSLDFDPRYQAKTTGNLNTDYRGGESHFPPDLLPFTHRTIPQVSPAGSSASTVAADAARLPAHHGPQSPIQPPFFDAYRTLPYSRSHSPFTSPHAPPPIRVPRQGGYVTVPRRPRQQSWSSEPPSNGDIVEPLYDNLGLRTTATGSSVLSLNRIGDGAPKTSSTPKSNKNHQNHPLSPCDPIAEHDPPQHPQMSQIAQTLPRSISAHRTLSPNNVEATMRANWARSPEPLNDSRRESTASLLPTPEGKTPKIPPRPPPKPKKRTSTGPLFEDEGEDGTEV